jgi:hypothetical protein
MATVSRSKDPLNTLTLTLFMLMRIKRWPYNFLTSLAMPTLSTRLNQQIAITFGVALTWACLDLIKHNYFGFLQTNNFQYSMYWLSAIHLLFVVFFGWLGATFFWVDFLANAIGAILFLCLLKLGIGSLKQSKVLFKGP